VLVPCYKESLDIVAKTLEAALAAELPAGCARTVYLLDDGKQRDKRKWCAAAGPGARATGGPSAPCRDDRKQRLSDHAAQRAGWEVVSVQWKGRLRRRSASSCELSACELLAVERTARSAGACCSQRGNGAGQRQHSSGPNRGRARPQVRSARRRRAGVPGGPAARGQGDERQERQPEQLPAPAVPGRAPGACGRDRLRV